MTELERLLLWMVYVGALEGRKRGENQRAVRTAYWKANLFQVRALLAMEGMTL
jgi:hypothetical protein